MTNDIWSIADIQFVREADCVSDYYHVVAKLGTDCQ
jgi:hypothetical protein